MEIDRRELLDAMKSSLPGVELGNTILEGSDTFIFKGGYIYSYNDNISVTSPLKAGEELQGAIKAREFFDLINRFKDDTISLVQKEGKWIVKSKSGARAELTLLESSIMAHVEKIHPEKPRWTKLPPNFFEGVQLSLFTNNRSALSGVCVKDNTMVSTDEIRINWFKLDGAITNPFWISDQACKELMKLEGIEKYFVSDSWVQFLSRGKVIFSCKKLPDANYPFQKIEAIKKKHEKADGDISGEIPHALVESINRAAALAMDIESFYAVKLSFSKEGIEVYSERSSGKFTELVKWSKAMRLPEPVSIFVDYSMIENGIAKSDGFYIKQLPSKSGKVNIKIIFTNKDGIQIVGTLEGNA